MISIILILLFVFSVLSVPVCHGVISGLYLYGMKIFPGLFISFILTNILVRILQQKNINNPWILVITGLMTGFPNGAYICSWYNKTWGHACRHNQYSQSGISYKLCIY